MTDVFANYEAITIIGEGTYGHVLKCRHKPTGQLVAIKRFKETQKNPKVFSTALRESRMLGILRHENIVDLLDVLRHQGHFLLVLELCEMNIYEYMQHCGGHIPVEDCVEFMWQTCRAVQYCHSQNVIHRDIKPENILISSLDHPVIKVCDFGFARTMQPANLTDYVATRWYRAPELLLGMSRYTEAVDVWAIGVLMLELMSGDPLFAGDHDLEQLAQVTQVLGPPPLELCRVLAQCKHWSRSALTKFRLDQYTEAGPIEGSLPPDTDTNGVSRAVVYQHLMARYPMLPADVLDFASRCLRYSAALRPTMDEVLAHPLFSQRSSRMQRRLDEAVRLEMERNPLKRLRAHRIEERERMHREERVKEEREHQQLLLRRISTPRQRPVVKLPIASSKRMSFDASHGTSKFHDSVLARRLARRNSLEQERLSKAPRKPPSHPRSRSSSRRSSITKSTPQTLPKQPKQPKQVKQSKSHRIELHVRRKSTKGLTTSVPNTPHTITKLASLRHRFGV